MVATTCHINIILGNMRPGRELLNNSKTKSYTEIVCLCLWVINFLSYQLENIKKHNIYKISTLYRKDHKTRLSVYLKIKSNVY